MAYKEMSENAEKVMVPPVCRILGLFQAAKSKKKMNKRQLKTIG